MGIRMWSPHAIEWGAGGGGGGLGVLPVYCQLRARRALSLSNMFCWEPKGSFHCTMSMAIAPFWFSTEHRWTALMPFWFSVDDRSNHSQHKICHMRTRRALLLYKVYGNNALLALNWRIIHWKYISKCQYKVRLKINVKMAGIKKGDNE